VGAKLLYQDDSIQHAGVVFTGKKLIQHIYKNFSTDHPAVNKEREFQAVTAACVLVKRELFFGAGGFDEGYRNGLEDVDLCFKLRQQGYKVVYNPRAAIYHLESKTPGRHDREKENSILFRSKWQDQIIADDQKFYAEDGIIMEVVDKQENTVTVRAHDNNENVFWREAKKYWQQGVLDKAEEYYIRALRFNPFDRRLEFIAQELADLYKSLGQHSQADAFYRVVESVSRLGSHRPAYLS
jgi:tetratricopeptide (TPR) repeat protein